MINKLRNDSNTDHNYWGERSFWNIPIENNNQRHQTSCQHSYQCPRKWLHEHSDSLDVWQCTVSTDAYTRQEVMISQWRWPGDHPDNLAHFSDTVTIYNCNTHKKNQGHFMLLTIRRVTNSGMIEKWNENNWSKFLVCLRYSTVRAQTEGSRKWIVSAWNGSTDRYMAYMLLVRALYSILIHVLLHKQTTECMSQMTGSKY
jgi:hypothetical protein